MVLVDNSACVWYTVIVHSERKVFSMPFMISTNIINTASRRRIPFDTENVDYFDDGIDATKAYSQLLVNILVAVMPMIALALVYLYGY